MQTHKNHHSYFIGAGLCIALSVASAVHAAPAPIITSTLDQSELMDKRFGIGLTVSLSKRPFIAVPDQISVLPYFSYRYQRFYIEGLDLGLNLVGNKRYNLNLLATPRFYEVKASFAKSGELDGIEQTNPTYLAGVSAQLNTDAATFTLQLLHDLLESDGNEAVLQIGKSFTVGHRWSLIPSFGVTYQDSALVDHFYGVQASEVRVGRPLYAGKAALNYNVTLNAVWKAKPQLDVLGQIKYERLGDGITDSPIVDETAIYYVTIGAVYRY